MRVVLLLLIMFSVSNCFEKDFNEKRHMIFTYSVNPIQEQYLGGSVLTIDPDKFGLYLNVKANETNASFNIATTKKLNSFTGAYVGGGYVKNENRNFQGVAGLIFNIGNAVYFEVGYESYKNSYNVGFGLSSIISRGVK